MKRPDIGALLSVFAKVGLVGFGGGSSLLPLIEKEVVVRHRWFGDEEYVRHSVASSVTPGALAIKLASAAGFDAASTLGAVAAPYAVVLPGLALMLVLLSVSSLVGGAAVTAIQRLSVGIFLFVVLVFWLYIERVIRRHRRPWKAAAFAAGTLLLTIGPALRRIVAAVSGLSADDLPPVVLGLGAADAMAAAFFLVLFLGERSGPVRRTIGAAAALAYVALCAQGLPFGAAPWTKAVGLAVLLALVLASVAFDAAARRRAARDAGTGGAEVPEAFPAVVALPDLPAFRPITPRTFLPVAGILLGIPAVLFAAAALLFPAFLVPYGDAGATLPGYVWACVGATVSTFGGGSSFLPIAEGFFVGGGFVPHDAFYQVLASLANALPGPIISELAPGAGFDYALAVTGGNIAAAWLAALLGGALTVAVSVLPMLAFLGFYDRLRASPRVHALQEVVMPVVCGLLVPTALTLLASAVGVLHGQGGVAPWLAALLAAAGVAALVVLTKWTKPADVVLLAGVSGTFFVLVTGLAALRGG